MAAAPSRPYRTWPAQLAVLLLTGGLAAMSRLPTTPHGEAEALATRFKFTRTTLYAPPVPEGVRHDVNPLASHFRYYLYQVGATAALGDLDGNGLADDLCQNDVRAKGAAVSAIPGTGERYAPWVVDFGVAVDPFTEWPTVCRIVDLNEDGLQDLYFAFAARQPIALLRREEPQGTPLSQASFVQQEIVPGGTEVWYTTTSTFADVDGDGHLDILLGNYFPDEATVYDATSHKPFEMNDSFSRARNGGTNRILLWDGATGGDTPSVRYRAVEDPLPGDGEKGWTLAIGAADLNGDHLVELYYANDFGPDQLLLNKSTPGNVKLLELRGTPDAMTPASMVLGNDSFKGMGIDFGDINEDGRFDLYVSNIASPFALQETHFLWTSAGDVSRMEQGVAPYVDQAVELGVAHSGWAWETRFDDLDNDAHLELLQATGFVRPLKGRTDRWPDIAQLGLVNDVATKDPQVWPALGEDTDIDGSIPNPFWQRGSDGRYIDLSGLVFPGYTPNTRGIATADVEGDGDLDLVYANLWQDSDYFRNDAPEPGRFLGLHLLLPPAGAPTGPSVVANARHPAWREGSPAVGTFVTVKLPDGRTLIRTVDGGNGHSGARSPDVHFGLGDLPADTSLPVTLAWRDRTGTVHEDNLTLAPGWHTVVLGGAPPAPEHSAGATP